MRVNGSDWITRFVLERGAVNHSACVFGSTGPSSGARLFERVTKHHLHVKCFAERCLNTNSRIVLLTREFVNNGHAKT